MVYSSRAPSFGKGQLLPRMAVPGAAPGAPGMPPPGLLFPFDEVEQCEGI